MQFLEFNFQKNFRQSFVALDFIHTKYFGLEVGEGIEERPHNDSAKCDFSQKGYVSTTTPQNIVGLQRLRKM